MKQLPMYIQENSSKFENKNRKLMKIWRQNITEISKKKQSLDKEKNYNT